MQIYPYTPHNTKLCGHSFKKCNSPFILSIVRFTKCNSEVSPALRRHGSTAFQRFYEVWEDDLGLKKTIINSAVTAHRYPPFQAENITTVDLYVYVVHA